MVGVSKVWCATVAECLYCGFKHSRCSDSSSPATPPLSVNKQLHWKPPPSFPLYHHLRIIVLLTCEMSDGDVVYGPWRLPSKLAYTAAPSMSMALPLEGTPPNQYCPPLPLLMNTITKAVSAGCETGGGGWNFPNLPLPVHWQLEIAGYTLSPLSPPLTHPWYPNTRR